MKSSPHNSTGQPLIVCKTYHDADYSELWHQMKAFTDERDASTPDEIWLVEHKPVFTQGQAGKPEHVLNTSDIPIVQTDRGGQVTYHGPGQVVIYFLMDIKRKGLGVRDFVSLMEDEIIKYLGHLGIHAELKDGAPGVYVSGKKIASLGLRVRKGCTYHGLSLNVDMDLSPFLQINPCGYQGLEMTQIRELLEADGESKAKASPSFEEVGQALMKRFVTRIQIESQSPIM